MRLRHIPGAEEAIAASPYVVQEPEREKGQWSARFGNKNPIEIEVGMGKGRFIMEQAQRHPERNYIGIERYSSVLLRGLEKREQLELPNIWFLCIDAKQLADIFAPGEVSRIYLNFSDSWRRNLWRSTAGFWRRRDVWNLKRTIRDFLPIPWSRFRQPAGN